MNPFVENMLGAQDVPPRLYFLNNRQEAFRRPGYIIAPRNDFNLNEFSIKSFHGSIKQHGYDTPTPWITVFIEKADAETFAKRCNAKYTIHEVDSSTWYHKGVVVVDALKVKRIGGAKLASELLVHLQFPIDSILDGLEKEKQKWKEHQEEERIREEAQEKQSKKEERYKRTLCGSLRYMTVLTRDWKSIFLLQYTQHN
jgi:hypothetical protein